MPISLSEILKLRTERRTYRWDEQDTIFYALSVGFGSDPLDERELAFVYGEQPAVVPTMSTVVAWGIGPDRALMGIDYTKLVHGEQAIELHKPIPLACEITAEARVTAVYDKGEGKGALIVTTTDLFDQDGSPLATLTNTLFARADGGFGGPPAPVMLTPVPDRRPDAVVEYSTRPEQALLYRLNGDLNPLHADPQVANRAGFPRPILHGLCTYGITCRAVLEAFEPDPARIHTHAGRFAGPVYPGETLEVDLWRDDRTISFQARTRERGTIVFSNGRTELRK